MLSYRGIKNKLKGTPRWRRNAISAKAIAKTLNNLSKCCTWRSQRGNSNINNDIKQYLRLTLRARFEHFLPKNTRTHAVSQTRWFRTENDLCITNMPRIVTIHIFYFSMSRRSRIITLWNLLLRQCRYTNNV